MSVLVVMACSPYQLVSQETLFATVWPNSVFSPGSIRRCIAVLRKVFDCQSDTASSLFVTHPKQGYSLEAEVHLHTHTAHSLNPVSRITSSVKGEQNINKGYKRLIKRVNLRYGLTAVALISACVSLLNLEFFEFKQEVLVEQSEPIHVSGLLPLTATEHQEYNAKVSPTGDKIAYLRIDALSEEEVFNQKSAPSQLWIKDLDTDVTTKISRTDGQVKAFAWSPDGKSLLYSVRDDDQEQFYQAKLSSPDFAQLLALNHQGQRVSSLQWSQANVLYFLSQHQHQIILTAHYLGDGITKSTWVFDDDFRPYELAVSLRGEELALIGFNGDQKSSIKVLTPNAERLIDVATLNQNRYFLSWHPNGQQLLLSDGQQLSLLSRKGVHQPIYYESFDFVRHPHFTPDGNNILLSLGKFDIDIIAFARSGLEPEIKLIDSNTVDRGAMLSPDKSKLAFISQRKGYPQLFLYEFVSGQTSLLYQNNEKLLGLSPPIWHPTKAQLAFANYEVPIVVNLEEAGTKLETAAASLGIPKAWFNSSNHLLTRSFQTPEYAKLSLDDYQKKTLPLTLAGSLLLSAKDQVISIESNKVTLKSLAGNLEQTVETDHKIVDAFSQRDTVYLVLRAERHDELWRLDLESMDKRKLQNLPGRIERLAGVTPEFVYYQKGDYQKDIVLLSLLTRE